MATIVNDASPTNEPLSQLQKLTEEWLKRRISVGDMAVNAEQRKAAETARENVLRVGFNSDFWKEIEKLLNSWELESRETIARTSPFTDPGAIAAAQARLSVCRDLLSHAATFKKIE